MDIPPLNMLKGYLLQWKLIGGMTMKQRGTGGGFLDRLASGGGREGRQAAYKVGRSLLGLPAGSLLNTGVILSSGRLLRCMIVISKTCKEINRTAEF